MDDIIGWMPKYNQMPSHHLRLKIDTHIVVDPALILDFLNTLTTALRGEGFDEVAFVHVGQGSVLAEIAVEQEKANVAKTTAETQKLRAETRLLNLKIVGGVTSLLFVAAAIGLDIADNRGAVWKSIEKLVEAGQATMCEFKVGESSFEIPLSRGTGSEILPDNGFVGTSPGMDAKLSHFLTDAEGKLIFNELGEPIDIQAEQQGVGAEPVSIGAEGTVSKALILLAKKPSSPDLIALRKLVVEIPQVAAQTHTSIIDGKLVFDDHGNPTLEASVGSFPLKGIESRLPIVGGTFVTVEAFMTRNGLLFPIRIALHEGGYRSDIK